MWESRRDFQGRWEEWKTCCWFSRLSTGRHFHRLLLFARRSFAKRVHDPTCLNHLQPRSKSEVEAVKLADFKVAVEDAINAIFHLFKSNFLPTKYLAYK